jgi:hypothetical protein
MTPTRGSRVYRCLLALLPAPFRREAEADLLEVFGQAYARVRGRGVVAHARFWCRLLADLAVTSMAEHMAARRDADRFRLPSPSSRRSRMRVVESAANVLRPRARTRLDDDVGRNAVARPGGLGGGRCARA